MSGIETQRQEDMTKPSRENFVLGQYNNWITHLAAKYEQSAVLQFLSFTTARKTNRITGDYLYRHYQEALRVFHNEWNGKWSKLCRGQVSGKSYFEIWKKFVYQLQCTKKGDVILDEVPPERVRPFCC